MTATDGDKDRPQNIVYFLTGQGIDPDNPANSKFDINRTTGEIFVLKVTIELFNTTQCAVNVAQLISRISSKYNQRRFIYIGNTETDQLVHLAYTKYNHQFIELSKVDRSSINPSD